MIDYKNITNNCNIKKIIEVAISLTTGKRRNFDVTIEGEESYTDGKRINIGLMPFLFKYSPKEIVDSIIAIALHESEHIMSSSFTELKGYVDEIKDEYTERYVAPAKYILNAIEDGRIEKIHQEKYKGNKKYFKTFRNIFHEEQSVRFVGGVNQYDINNVLFAICTYATMNKLPIGWETYENSRYDRFLNEVLGYIDSAVKSNSHKECTKYAKEIFKIFAFYFKEEIEKGLLDEKALKAKIDDIKEGCEGLGVEVDLGNSKLNDSNSEFKKLSELINNEVNTLSEKEKAVECNLDEIIECKLSSGKSDYKLEVRKLRNEVKKIVDCIKHKNKKGRRSGRINTSLLWKTALMEDRVFNKRYFEDDRNMCIYLLIDCSGSMYGNKIAIANRIGAIVEESFSEYINLEIAYFSDSHEIIRKFDSDRSKYYVWSAKKEAYGGNSDYLNLKIARELLEKRNEKSKFIMIISDGEPCPHKSGIMPIDEVKKEVLRAKRRGIDTIAIAFENNNEIYRYMYENIIYATSEDIEKKLCNKIKRLIV